MIRLTILCAFLAYALPSARAADDAAAAARASLERIQAARKAQPGDGLLLFYEAMTRLKLGERDAALDLLNSLKGRKLGLIPVRGGGFDSVWGDPKFQAIRKELLDQEPQTPAAPVAFRLGDPKLIPEGIAYDPTGDRFFIGSMAQGKIIVTDAKGKARDFSSADDKLDQVLGLAVDAERGYLYAVSTNGFHESAKAERRNAVLRYDLKDGRLLDRFPAPEATQLNDVAVAPDGSLYATDSQTGTLFHKKPDEKTRARALIRFGETGSLPGANGISVAADGTVYVALSTGIVRANTPTRVPAMLPQPDSVVTGGIDGLYWHGGDLFGVQNVPNPGRVIRIALTDGGSRIAGLTVLQSHHHPDFDEPTTGAIAHGALYVIGNSYVAHLQPDGTIKDAGDLKGTAIVAVPLAKSNK